MLKNTFNYKEWSDKRLLTALSDIPAARSKEVIHFAQQQLNHMVIVEEIFRAHLQSLPSPHQSTNTLKFPSLQELAARLARSNRWFQEFISDISDEHLQKTVLFDFTDGQSGCMSTIEILFHIINHGTYHRSAIAHQIQHAGYIRPADTFSMYIHQVEPNRRAR